MYLAKKDAKDKPIKFSKPRTMEGLTDFFKENDIPLVLPGSGDL